MHKAIPLVSVVWFAPNMLVELKGMGYFAVLSGAAIRTRWKQLTRGNRIVIGIRCNTKIYKIKF